MTEYTTYDYIVAGGGQAGCVLASRLSQYLPECTIALVEVGRNAHDDPMVRSALRSRELHGTDLRWNDMTSPQQGAEGRTINHGGGKLLSGGTAVNHGTWVRGHEMDFKHWAEIVGDDRWGYKSLLQYFRRCETHFKLREDCENPEEHGFDGPIHTVEAPEYPLGPIMLKALQQAGHQQLADANSGHPLGVGRWIHNWRSEAGACVRQPAGQSYDLSRVTVITNTLVRRVIIERQEGSGDLKAVGIDIGGGKQLRASREVIVSCGGLRTPQLLMLSGIGNSSHLESRGVTPLLDVPEVGLNFHNHCAVMLFWKLKHPEKGLAIGHPSFDPQGRAPSEWLLTGTVPADRLAPALVKDGVPNPAVHPNLISPRAHYEVTFGYYAAGAEPGVLPIDGSIMTTGVANWLPTSRGSITLKSTNPDDAPIIDPAYLSTEHDLCIIREAIRELMRVMKTPAAETEVAGQFQLPGTNVNIDSTDEEINDRVRKTCTTWLHAGGTAAMGKVVDTDCRVKGVSGLRVVDASIIPVPLAAHYQVPVYAIAEQAAEMISGIA